MWPFDRTTYRTVQIKHLRPSYDYVIVGGGTAGCVIANRLSENPNVSVLVVERGQVDFSWTSSIPPLSQTLTAESSNLVRTFESVPQKFLDDRKTKITTGSALGGTSKINGMIYTRAIPAEFDTWTEQGRRNWSYDDIKQYFWRPENAIGLGKTTNYQVHNTTGEWKNTSSPSSFLTTHSVLHAAQDLGFPFIADLNHPHKSIYGIAKLRHTIDEQGRRNDTASAFLPARLVWQRKRNLDICVNAIVTHLSICSSSDDDDALLSVDKVHIETDTIAPDGEFQSAAIKANKEVVLCAGSLGTTQLLLHSGIGPRDHLESLGIQVYKDLPGVGSNLQDHLGVPIFFNVPRRDSFTALLKRPTTFPLEMLKYLLRGSGMFSCSLPEIALFGQSELLSPDLHHIPAQAKFKDSSTLLPDIELLTISSGKVDEGDKAHGGFTLYVLLAKPYSPRGTVRLRSKDPRDAPAVDPNFLMDNRDRNVLHLGIKLGLRLKQQMVSNGYPITNKVTPSGMSPDDLDAYIAEHGCSCFHYSSTCRMAPEDDTLPGVVDDELRVHGFKGLRIADASIFPSVVANHPQATVVAVAEKCSDLLKEFF